MEAYVVFTSVRCYNCLHTYGLDVAPPFRDSGGNVALCTRPCHVCEGKGILQLFIVDLAFASFRQQRPYR